MSLQSHELARVYSDEKVQRAKEFLRHRQQEVALFRDRMVLAQYACTELKHWLQDIEADVTVARSLPERLASARRSPIRMTILMIASP